MSAMYGRKEVKIGTLFFAIGILFTLILSVAVGAIKEKNPAGDTIIDALTPGVTNVAQQTEETRNKPSPEDYFAEDQIKVYKDRVILQAENIQWATFTDTKSMLPVINKDSNALQVVPNCPEDIKLGDIVSYKSDYAEGIIIHRIAFVGEDDEGIYFVLKGDNNPASDPGKIRCSQIQRKVVGILY